MLSIDFIIRQQVNLVDNQKCPAGFRPLCNKILFLCQKLLESFYKIFSLMNIILGTQYPKKKSNAIWFLRLEFFKNSEKHFVNYLSKG